MTSAPVITAWTEDQLLGEFWRRVRADVDRLALLREMSEIVLERPAEWDSWTVRAAMPSATVTLRADQCFACLSGERALYWHHVLMVKHGGSNAPPNFVALCHRCHRAVHPWMPAPTSIENRHGWTAVGDLVDRAVKRLAAVFGRPRR